MPEFDGDELTFDLRLKGRLSPEEQERYNELQEKYEAGDGSLDKEADNNEFGLLLAFILDRRKRIRGKWHVKCGLRRTEVCPLWVPLGEATIDHIKRRGAGGTHEGKNLQPACLPCNSSKNG